MSFYDIRNVHCSFIISSTDLDGDFQGPLWTLFPPTQRSLPELGIHGAARSGEEVAVTHRTPTPPPECACRQAGWRLDKRPPPDWWLALFAQRMSGCKADGRWTTTTWMFFGFFYCSPARTFSPWRPSSQLCLSR